MRFTVSKIFSVTNVNKTGKHFLKQAYFSNKQNYFEKIYFLSKIHLNR